MDWNLTWGTRLKELEAIEKSTGEKPLALLNRPLLSQFEQPFYIAFQTLSGSRQWTMAGPSTIPLSEVVAYFNLMEIVDADEKEDYLLVLQKVDAEFINQMEKKRKQTPKGRR